ncbi:putative regulator of cell autolysis [Flavobacterium cauense R2A-7]|uniref:Tetratricopeptide repeat protein n=1 Tax=Flavobacterium cauense R2A-7 TaxID=1341154 RepID=V6S659_9FLAO|nr:histidine kinase [Flavobacterium cauense]ESU19880.1 putative regulator of cell autolysis [Flavobacterium cauense R2A-7]KGO83686.1 regulator of cell autolysis [Flavobacterium cauense R2A-7]TWI12298.1 tetratricopeptide repeat protein [Flavobacterium cauense R2A-7]
MRLKEMVLAGILMLGFSSEALAQDTIKPVMKSKKASVSKISKAADDLKESLNSNDELGIAKNYENLAQGFIDKEDYAKGEEYLKKALAGYLKLKRTEDRIRVTRALAKVQEAQNKVGAAIKNYEAAGAASMDKSYEQVNQNDANRLRSINNPAAQAVYNKSNIQLLEKEDKKAEVADAYVQQAEVSLQQKNKEVAIESYKKAISYSKDQPEAVVKLKNEIAKVYASDNQFDKAIAINEKLLTEAQAKNDFDIQIKQLQELATIYFKKNEPEKAITVLKQAYQLAMQQGKTAEVKTSLLQLLQYYKSNGKDKESIALYDDFFQHFDKLIQNDSSLIDEKTFQVTEEKIRQLEKEKALKDELISKKNTFNYFLMGSMVLLLLFFGLIVKALYSIKTKNKEIALQSLRREMNPHFIFNSLNSVNQFISQNKELEANKYLTSYSHLMRNMMENSNKDFISLSSEIEQLKKYLDLEHLRFQDKFDYEITVDENLDTETTFVPNMLIQPHLENAIWHGLRYRETKGLLQLCFGIKNNKISVLIDDDGIGLTKSAELKTQNQKVHQSRGLTNTKERISLLNELYKANIAFSITEKNSGTTGTLVEITFPILDKP